MMVRGLVAAVSIAIAAALPAAAQSKLDTAMSFAETAAALSKEGDFAGAVKLYLKAYDLSREPVLLYNAARALDKKGDLRDARAMYERYLAAESDAAGIARGREKLRDLLERMPGSLRIETDPPGATLVLDGRPAGTSPATVPDLRPGPHEVVARLAGYEPTVARVEVQPDAESRATVALEPAPVDLTVRCDCPGARVEVDGTPVGTGPLARAVPVRPGRHVVTVWSAAGEGRSRQVEVPVGRAVRVEVEAAGGPPSPPTPSPATLPPPSPPVRAAAQTPAPAETVSARAERRGPTPWTWVTIGLGSAMVVTGGVLTYLAAQDRAEVSDAKRGGDGAITGISRSAALDAQASADVKARASAAMYAIGGASVVTGIVLWIATSGRGPAVSAAPLPGGGAVGIAGRF